MKIAMSMSACKSVYEDHFKEELPGDLPFKEALSRVVKDLGEEAFIKKYKGYVW